jgi:hypothetical protein
MHYCAQPATGTLREKCRLNSSFANTAYENQAGKATAQPKRQRRNHGSVEALVPNQDGRNERTQAQRPDPGYLESHVFRAMLNRITTFRSKPGKKHTGDK